MEKSMTAIPDKITIYHIAHIDRLESIVSKGSLFCDAIIQKNALPGTIIGMEKIKSRRLNSPLKSQPGLNVGDCIPFYFCPRSVMLYMLFKSNHEDLRYRGGQEHVVHLFADVYRTIEYANENNLRWAFTTSNAGAKIFKDYNLPQDFDKIDWNAIVETDWGSNPDCKEHKQAEFLLEKSFPWSLVEGIGVYSAECHRQVSNIINGVEHKPDIKVKRNWYY
jgi:hypothetical protein